MAPPKSKDKAAAKRPSGSPTTAEVRAWALTQPEEKVGRVNRTGTLPTRAILAWNKTHPVRKYGQPVPAAAVGE